MSATSVANGLVRTSAVTYYLPSSELPDAAALMGSEPGVGDAPDLEDLRIFWGREIYRLEYLVHLIDTGRIKNEPWPPVIPVRVVGP